jgi:hypothetical protein
MIKKEIGFLKLFTTKTSSYLIQMVQLYDRSVTLVFPKECSISLPNANYSKFNMTTMFMD